MLALLKLYRSGLKEVFLYLICTFALSHICIFVFAQVNPTPAAERVKKIQQRKELEKKSLLNEIQFRNVGPTVMSGRVSDIEANPDDPTEFYVAYSSGGLWHTQNNGL